MRINDAITGVVLVVFAVAEIAYTRTFPSLHGQNYGPDLFPVLIGAGLLLCGLVLIARGILARRGATDSTKDTEVVAGWIDFTQMSVSSHARVNAALTLLFMLLYILFSEQLGFILFSVFTIAFLLYRLGSSVWLSCVIAVVTTVVIQFLFAKVLLVPLPAGLLQGLV